MLKEALRMLAEVIVSLGLIIFLGIPLIVLLLVIEGTLWCFSNIGQQETMILVKIVIIVALGVYVANKIAEEFDNPKF